MYTVMIDSNEYYNLPRKFLKGYFETKDDARDAGKEYLKGLNTLVSRNGKRIKDPLNELSFVIKKTG